MTINKTTFRKVSLIPFNVPQCQCSDGSQNQLLSKCQGILAEPKVVYLLTKQVRNTSSIEGLQLSSEIGVL